MTEATITFEGQAFHWAKWAHILTDSGFRLSGPSLHKAIYASGGNAIFAESRGFVARDEKEGHEWHLILKETQRWEGTIKFYSVLLAAFSMPQNTSIAVEDHTFTDREALRTHAENALIGEFALDELIDNGVYQKGAGIQFR